MTTPPNPYAAPARRDRAFQHPEYGALTVGWVAHQMAGHDLHHLKQIETIDAAGQPGRREPPQ